MNIAVSTRFAVTIERDALHKALAFASHVVESKNTIPIISHAKLTAHDQSLTIEATDLDITAAVTVPADLAMLSGESAITAPAGTLADIVRKLPSGAQISLEMAEGGASLALRSGRARFTVNTLTASDFPELNAGERPHAFRLPADGLAKLIAATDFAMSTEETRYYLNGIYFHAAEVEGAPKLRAVATDGHRLARADIDLPAGAAGMPGVIVTRKMVAELTRMVKDGGQDAEIELSERIIRVRFAGATLTSKLIDGTFPDYARVIPAPPPTIATFERKALLETLERVAIIGTGRDRLVRFEFGPERLLLTARNPDLGQAMEEIEPLGYEGAPMTIGFNARYMATILATLTGESVAIGLTDPGSPARIAADGDDSVPLVLMPIRVPA